MDASDNTFTFGTDTLMGNAGQDILIGDVESFSLNLAGGKSFLPILSSATASSNKFTFGADTLDGGEGQDILIGDIASGEVNEYQQHNTLIWGDDTLTGGSESDTFIFGLYKNKAGLWTSQGTDTITDFNREEDKLNFHSLFSDSSDSTTFTQADFETAISSITGHAGNDTLTIAFDGGGSVILEEHGDYVYTNVGALVSDFNISFDTTDITSVLSS